MVLMVPGWEMAHEPQGWDAAITGSRTPEVMDVIQEGRGSPPGVSYGTASQQDGERRVEDEGPRH